jgi:HPt (histidine-containing phosphotransfer) domain-containing protein
MLNLADTFVSSLQSDLQALKNALSESDLTEMQRLLHTLKGYVTFLCGPDLSQQMIQLEAMSRAKHLAELSVDIGQAIPSLQNLLVEVGHWIEKDLKPAT